MSRVASDIAAMLLCSCRTWLISPDSARFSPFSHTGLPVRTSRSISAGIHLLQRQVRHHREVAHRANGVFGEGKSEDFYGAGAVQAGHHQANFPIGIAFGQEYITSLFAYWLLF
jgi:hypothetical protein